MAMVGSEDIGRTAYGIFLAGAHFIGQTVAHRDQLLTP
jgi:hypothetical protein